MARPNNHLINSVNAGMIDKGTVSLRSYAAKIFSNYAASMQYEIASMPGSVDIEHIHRLRVASRRIRTAFELFSTCLPAKRGESWKRQLRQVTRALGATRDVDVQIAMLKSFQKKIDSIYSPGIRRLLLRLTQKRNRLQLIDEKMLSNLEKKGTLKTIIIYYSHYPSSRNKIRGGNQKIGELAYSAISDRLDAFLSYEKYLLNQKNVRELHQMRIAAKGLRYTLEILSPLFADKLENPLGVIREIQTTLGEIHDCDFWITSLPSFIEKETNRTEKYFGHTHPMKVLIPGFEFFLHDRRQMRSQGYVQFKKDWRNWKRQNIWGQLRNTIKDLQTGSF